MGMAVSVPRYTVDDLEEFPDDGNRYELLDGVLLVTPAPNVSHQVIATRLMVVLATALAEGNHAHVVGPGAVAVPPGTQLQPDILVYPAHFPLSATWQEVTEHWLAVEILSRSSRMYDREFKRDAYVALGVHEVWLVDLRDRSVEICRAPGPGHTVRERILWEPPGLGDVVTVDLNATFDGLV